MIEIAMQRDVMGRIRSLQTTIDNPTSGTRASWRGYLYDVRGHLTGEFQHDDALTPGFADRGRAASP